MNNKANKTSFKKGHIPFNKLHPESCKPNSGSFKKGNVPINPFKKGHISCRKGKGIKGWTNKGSFKKGQPCWSKGKTKKDYPQLGNSGTKSPCYGEKNSQWKGGITPLRKQIRLCFEYRQWRSDVFTRDNFTCQKCFIKGNELHAHHCPKSFSSIIKEYQIKTLEQALSCPELWNINNGKTHCKDCHKTIHRKKVK